MPEPRQPHDDADEPESGREPRAGDEASARDASGADQPASGDAPDASGPDEADEFVGDAGDEEEADDLLPQEGHRVVFVSTAVPVQISVAPLDDERAPEGSALGAYIGQRLVARCAMPPEAVERLMELDLFSEPVPLALLAVEEDPGLQCRLFALVPAERIADAQHENEPWKASVPSFEDTLDDDDEEDEDGDEVLVGSDDDDEDEEDDAVASILLGHIVRFQQDRKFADDLTAEAVDVLQKIVLGGTLEDANAKAVDDFLKSL
jgi:hypothetical protein